MAQYDDEIEGLKAFAKVNARAKKQGLSLDFVMAEDFVIPEVK